MRFLFFILFAFLVFGAKAQKVYTANSADIRIFVVDKEYRADLVVYRTNKESRAKASDNRGIWFFCDKASRADKKVCFVDKEYRANLKVFFTDKEYRAGWRNQEKKHLM